jgi:hypothetical protein
MSAANPGESERQSLLLEGFFTGLSREVRKVRDSKADAEGHPASSSEELERGGTQANRDASAAGESVKSSTEAPGREVIDERRRLRQTVPPGKI